MDASAGCEPASWAVVAPPSALVLVAVVALEPLAVLTPLRPADAVLPLPDPAALLDVPSPALELTPVVDSLVLEDPVVARSPPPQAVNAAATHAASEARS